MRFIYVLKMIRQYFERNGYDKNIMQSDTALNINIPKVKVKKGQSKLRNISHRWNEHYLQVLYNMN
jgi:broad specificity polyphosphatase/5'/3'-nucleotidase SurE